MLCVTNAPLPILLILAVHHPLARRVEDTDAARSTRESEDAMVRDLKWLGLDWDEGERAFGVPMCGECCMRVCHSVRSGGATVACPNSCRRGRQQADRA